MENRRQSGSDAHREERRPEAFTDLTASGELTVPGTWSLFVPGIHLHLPRKFTRHK